MWPTLAEFVSICLTFAHTEATKQCLLTVYVRDALAAKGGCAEHKLTSFSSLLETLTQEDFSEVVQPVLEKLQKKNPDSILLAVASLVKHVRIDLSAHVGVFLLPLLRQLRSAKEDVRTVAVELMGSLARRCGDGEVGARVPCSILVHALYVLQLNPCVWEKPLAQPSLPCIVPRHSSPWF